jgi:ATP-dependent helicase HrpB
LPVERVVPQIRALLDRGRSVILHAPPGAGKTTLVPGACLDSAWLNDRRIIMLEPRRVAARAAAARIASLRKEQVGDTIGYRTRADSRVGPRTRIEVVTEGVLTRRIQRDPTLEDVGLVIFDEFHERSLIGDLGLALALHSRALVRDDLRILVMSATLDAAAVAALLGDAEVITAEGRVFPIETIYKPPREQGRTEATVTGAIREALARHDGEALVFLPGAGEIRRVQDLLGDSLGAQTDVLALHGSVPAGAQDAAIAAARPGRRRVVLATSIAETSLTIPGVRIVIDGGLARRPRFSPRTGMTRLETVRVSRATADQRRGRAGRTAPGICYRLWHEHEELIAAPLPEIVEADLAPLALDLATAGLRDPGELRWIDPPSPSSFAVARELLVELGLVDTEFRPTALGRAAANLPLHPRLARMVAAAGSAEDAGAAAMLSVLLSERDIVVGDSRDRDPDLRHRIEIIDAARRKKSAPKPPGLNVNQQAVERIAHEADRIVRLTPRTRGESVGAPALLATAYPDRVGAARAGQRGRFILRAGVEAQVDPASSLAGEEFIVAPELDGKRPVSRVYLAMPVGREDVERLFADQMEVERTVQWNATSESVISRERRRLGAIVLDEREVPAAPEDTGRALLEVAVGRGLLDTDDLRQLLARLAIARSIRGAEWPELSRESLASTTDEWLLPRAMGMRRLSDAMRIDAAEALRTHLGYNAARELDRLVPTHVVLPTGTRAVVDYSNPEAPSISARIQELFGLPASPTIGSTPVTIHLLSPANRPVQVTRDLAGFWKGSYFDVRKDMRGRYPKHPWPDDPASASPTRRTKPR